MSENNQKTPAPANSEKKDNPQGKGGQNRRNHHRPYNKGGNRPRPAAARAENEAVREGASAPQSNKSAENAQPRERKNNPNNQNNSNNPKRNGKPNGGKGRGNDRRGGYNPHHGPERRPYDPYEKPDKEEIALSELRARIVLKSADGTAPTVYGAPPATAEEPAAIPVDVAPAAETEDVATPTTEAPAATENKKVEVVGVRFRSAGKMYYFDPHGMRIKKGDFVVVETTRGPEFGEVCLGNSMVNVGETVTPLRPIVRVATPEDVAHNAENREKEKTALAVCQEKIRAHGLDMKLIDVQYAFDNSKLLFYFAAEGRVDFRDLVRDLASVFRTRIELRQIGIRDEAKMLGGIGACGRALCCSTFLPDFAQVSIKMAKEQNLSLNSTKISGVCGRLMCCLRYESEVYTEEIRKTPANDTVVRTEDGVGTVISSNPLAGTVRVVLKDSPDTAPKQYHRDNVTVLGKNRRTGNAEKAPEEEKTPED